MNTLSNNTLLCALIALFALGCEPTDTDADRVSVLAPQALRIQDGAIEVLELDLPEEARAVLVYIDGVEIARYPVDALDAPRPTVLDAEPAPSPARRDILSSARFTLDGQLTLDLERRPSHERSVEDPVAEAPEGHHACLFACRNADDPMACIEEMCDGRGAAEPGHRLPPNAGRFSRHDGLGACLEATCRGEARACAISACLDQTARGEWFTLEIEALF